MGDKKKKKGKDQLRRGYKLHLDVADGQLPISAVLTSASVHDSQVAIPLMMLTAQRVVHLYELMDSAYDADDIHAHSRQLNHVPIIAPHPRRGTKKPSQLPKEFPVRPTPQLTRSEEHTSELQSPDHLVCRLLLEKKKTDQRIRLARDSY